MSRVEGMLERLHGLYPRLIDLSLDRLLVLLDRLGNPQNRLPPVIHVAGTNGKGSTCAFIRAIAEAAGWKVHVYTSPHLVRFNERIRVAGTLVDDAALEAALDHVIALNDGAPITVFEVITAAAFHLFAATPAALCVLEVGLGGRGDATNVIASPAACAITALSLDHREMLGDTLAAIAAEKAGIIKPGVPVAIGAQPDESLVVLLQTAARLDTPVRLRGHDWEVTPTPTGFRYVDAWGALALPLPALAGPYQLDNAGIAIAALHAAGCDLPDTAFAAGMRTVEWPARMQRLNGRLAALLPSDWELWLDGGHNPGAGAALAAHLRDWSDRPVHLVIGMKQAKDSAAFLAPLLPLATTVWAVAEPEQHLALPVEAIVAASGGIARPGPHVTDALGALASGVLAAGALASGALAAGALASDNLARGVEGRATAPARVLICGSLYLAGEVLKADAPG
jgi:dihydrofolate synthase/folylpolyglutamate synthase